MTSFALWRLAGAASRDPDPARRAARQFAFRLWAACVLLTWGAGVQLAELWWLTNAEQQRWILFCYAWEVPIIGWLGTVLVPYLQLRGLQRRAAAGEPGIARVIARFPLQASRIGLGLSTIGYLLGGLQVELLASLPRLELAKVVAQGFALGAIYAVVVYLAAEAAIRASGVSVAPRDGPDAADPPIVHSLYGKILMLTVTLMLGVTIPILFYALTESQRQQERLQAQALLRALDDAATRGELVPALVGFGPHTYVSVIRRSNNYVIAGARAGSVIYADGHRDFGPIHRGDRGWFASRDVEHKVVAFLRRPGAFPDGDDALVVAVSPLSDYGAALIPPVRTASLVALCALIVGVGIAVGLARSIVDPITRLRAAASRMAAGERGLDALGLVGGDEVVALAHAFDRMEVEVRRHEAELREAYERLQQAQAQLIQHERLSAVGRLVSGVAHELNNPLSAVLHLAEDLQMDRARPSAEREALQVISDQVRRCRAIVRDLLSFVRGRSQRREPVRAADLVLQAQAAAQPALRATGARLELVLTEAPGVLRVDRSGLEQVLTNLIVNGAQAAGRDGVVRVEVTVQQGEWTFVVEDSGSGIPQEVLARVFEPFFTTKPEGEGTGLGLAVSLGIVERHGGTLQVESHGRLGGARFTVRLPEAATAAAAGETSTSAPPKPRRELERRALVVDDEHSIRLALGRYLHRQGWDVDEAEDGEEALAKLAQAAPGLYGLVISDLRMPRRSGIEVHDWMQANRPDLFARLVMITGDVASPSVSDFIARTTRPVIEKPFELGTLAAAVRQVCRSS